VGSLRQVRPFHRADRLALSLSDPTAMQNPRSVQDTLRTPNSALVCTSRQVWPFQANARNRLLTTPVAMQKVKLTQDTELPKKARLLTRQVRPFHISADDPTAVQNDALRQETLVRKPVGGNAMPKGKPSGTRRAVRGPHGRVRGGMRGGRAVGHDPLGRHRTRRRGDQAGRRHGGRDGPGNHR
jgi:hypothetical protein